MISRIEALADSLIHYSGALDPLAETYQARNPGVLRAFLPQHPRTEHGYRVFKSWLDGYQALLFDLRVKCEGRSRAKVNGTSTIRDLIRAYSLPDGTAGYVAKWLRKATADETVSTDTQLHWFIDCPAHIDPQAPTKVE